MVVKTKTGIIKWWETSRILWNKFIWEKSILVKPPTGNQPVFCANKSIKMAKKKEGIAIPILDSIVKNLSNQEL